MKRTILSGAIGLAAFLLIGAVLGADATLLLQIGTAAMVIVNATGAAVTFGAARRLRGAERASFALLGALFVLWATTRATMFIGLLHGGSIGPSATIVGLVGTATLSVPAFVLFYVHYREKRSWDGPIDAAIMAVTAIIVGSVLITSGHGVGAQSESVLLSLQAGLLVGLALGFSGMLMWRRSAVHCWLRWGLAGIGLLFAQVALSFTGHLLDGAPDLRVATVALGALASGSLALMAIRRVEMAGKPAITTTLATKPRSLTMRLLPALMTLSAVTLLVWNKGPLGYLAIGAVGLVLLRGIRTLRTVEGLLDERNVLAMTDTLTHAFNRRHLEHELPVMAARAARSGEPLSALLVDLDGFKAVNDTRGHGAGDHLLQTLASAMRSELRAGDILFRLGGDEFVVLAPADIAGATELAERIRERISQVAHGALPDGPHVTASIGVVAVPPHPQLRRLLRRADAALYLAKRNGRNRVVIMKGEQPQSPSTPT